MSAFERHYSVRELSKLWAWSPKTTFRRFVREAGVLLVRREETLNKRPYSQLRIPESVAARVYEKYVVKKLTSVVSVNRVTLSCNKVRIRLDHRFPRFLNLVLQQLLQRGYPRVVMLLDDLRGVGQ
jgi:hypothetical protein